MIKKGDDYRALNRVSDDYCLRMENLKLSDDKIQMTVKDEYIFKNGNVGQGESLKHQKFVFRK